MSDEYIKKKGSGIHLISLLRTSINFLNDAGSRVIPLNRPTECALRVFIIGGVGSESHQILWSALIRRHVPLCVYVCVPTLNNPNEISAFFARQFSLNFTDLPT